MKHRKPDIDVHPEIQGVRLLDFGKTKEVFVQTAPSVDLLRKQLQGLAIEQGHSPDRK
jgi:hypothetical protein